MVLGSVRASRRTVSPPAQPRIDRLLEYGLELDRADETVEAVPAAEDLAEVLGVQPASALLEIRRRAWDVHGAPVEYAHAFFRADRTRVHMQKYRTNWKRTVRLGRK